MAGVIIVKAIICIALISLLLPLSDQTGFTLDLIHRSSSLPSPRSRLLAESESESESEFEDDPQVTVFNFYGQYVVEYFVGTPPVLATSTVDTGSDLTWIQCAGCRTCFKQLHPMYDPFNSTTFNQVECGAPQCYFYDDHRCNEDRSNCRYEYLYADGTFSTGALATDTFTLAPNVSVPGIVFGCGSINRSPTRGDGESGGIFGLAGGEGSFVRQLGPMAQGKFSYCLVSYMNVGSAITSKLHFGDHAVVSGPGAVTTALVEKSPPTPLHMVTLEGISIGDRRVGAPSDPLLPDSIEGNMILDSGSTMSRLPLEQYEEFVKEIRSSVKLEEVEDPVSGLGGLCYPWQEDLGLPQITFHFRGADLRLNQENIFARMADDVACLAVVESPPQGYAVLGSLAQANFLMGYDLDKKSVTFKPAACGMQ